MAADNKDIKKDIDIEEVKDENSVDDAVEETTETAEDKKEETSGD